MSDSWGSIVTAIVALLIFMSPHLEKQSDKMTKTFTDNLN